MDPALPRGGKKGGRGPPHAVPIERNVNAPGQRNTVLFHNPRQLQHRPQSHPHPPDPAAFGAPVAAPPAVFKIIAHEGASAPLTGDDLRLIEPATEEWGGARLSRALAENADFMVVGVLGTPSVGKSELLNHLCGLEPEGDGRTSWFRVGERGKKEKDGARHTTAGVDVRVSADRVIAVDTPPAFSPSLLKEVLKVKGSVWNRDATPESLQELHALQMAVFLLAVCHVVLVVGDGLKDTRLWSPLRTADALMSSLQEEAKLAPSVAEVLFVCSCVPANECTARHIQPTQFAMNDYFAASSFNRQEPKPPKSAPSSEEGATATTAEPSSRVNFTILPQKGGNPAVVSHVSQGAMLEDLQLQLFSLPRRSMTTSGETKPVTEREWLQLCERVWSAIKKSPALAAACQPPNAPSVKRGGKRG